MALLLAKGFKAAAFSEMPNPAWALKCWERPGLGLVDWAMVEGARGGKWT